MSAAPRIEVVPWFSIPGNFGVEVTIPGEHHKFGPYANTASAEQVALFLTGLAAPEVITYRSMSDLWIGIAQHEPAAYALFQDMKAKATPDELVELIDTYDEVADALSTSHLVGG